MLLSQPCRRLFGVARPSALPNILKYEGSEVQHTLHQYKKDEAYIDMVARKNKSLDLEKVFRIADRSIQIREYLFEQPTSGVAVIPEGKSTL